MSPRDKSGSGQSTIEKMSQLAEEERQQELDKNAVLGCFNVAINIFFIILILIGTGIIFIDMAR